MRPYTRAYWTRQNGWTSPQMLRRYGASAFSTRARRTYDHARKWPICAMAARKQIAHNSAQIAGN
jgi:hypothetical protein